MTDLTLRPDSAGDDTNWTPNTGANYAAVDEASNDADTTYVARAGTEVDDLYNIATDAALTGAMISGITIYVSAKYVESGTGVISVSPTLKIGLKTSATEYWDTGDVITSSYANYSQAWAVNPADSAAWEKADIDALQIGIRSAQTTGTGSKVRVPRVTQIWIVVTYTSGPTYTLSCEQGSFALTGQAAGLLAGRLLSCEQGTANLTGQTAGLLAGRLLTCEQGASTLTGQTASLVVHRKIDMGQGSIALSGQDVTLTYHGAGPTYTLSCEAGSFTATGQDVSLLAGRKITLDQGAYTLTGQDVSLLAGRMLTMSQGAYTLTGQDVGLLAGRALSCDQGAYTLTGQDIDLTYTPAAATGVISLTLIKRPRGKTLRRRYFALTLKTRDPVWIVEDL